MVERMEPLEDQFERELREQLRSRSAPAGFAESVMARVSERRRPHSFWQPAWRWAAITAVIVVTVLGGVEHDRQQRIAGERARRQVLLALRITGTTLRQVQEKVAAQANSENGGDNAQE